MSNVVIPPGICGEIAAERNYRRIQSDRQLAAYDHQLTERQQQIPGLLFPVYRLGHPTPYTYVLRPDRPRMGYDGKMVKYEWPERVPLCLDVLPRYQKALTEPTIPLWITEGAKKADALATAFGALIVPVNLNGVWGWRRRSKDGASHPLKDLDMIAWTGRLVVLAFDNDVTRKREVQDALKALGRQLKGRGATVRALVLPYDGEKVGVDDALAAGMTPNTLLALIRDLDDLPVPDAEVFDEPGTALVEVAPVRTPRLPNYAQLPDDLAAQGSPWLDAYVAFSRRWSPQSYAGFHEAIALWLLSTVAARRVALDYGGEQYTNLYIALCARTSLFAKSTAASIAKQVLDAIGLPHLLAPDDASPQAFLRGMTLRVPEGFAQAPEDRQFMIRQRLMFAAQKGWFYDEFGQKLHAMMQNAGSMVDFRGHLRRLDDCPPTYEYVTVSRGSDLIERPYLALLASMTPADLRPHARKGSALWGDGFLARFALVTPPADLHVDLEDFPEGARLIPPAIVQPVRAWHERLGLPALSITERTNDKGEGTGCFDVDLTPAQPQRCVFGEGVRAAVSAYRRALHDILQAGGDNTDLDGNYTRLHAKALRVAMLLASLENGGRIELRHWARAQQIAERWRADLHHLVAQLGEGERSRERTAEDRILRFLERQPEAVSVRTIARYVKGLSTGEIRKHLTQLVDSRLVEEINAAKTVLYRALNVPDVSKCRSVEVSNEIKNGRHIEDTATVSPTTSALPQPRVERIGGNSTLRHFDTSTPTKPATSSDGNAAQTVRCTCGGLRHWIEEQWLCDSCQPRRLVPIPSVSGVRR